MIPIHTEYIIIYGTLIILILGLIDYYLGVKDKHKMGENNGR